MKPKNEIVVNAVGRKVPTVVNGAEQIAYPGIGQHVPNGRRHAPPIRSSADYPADGNKVVGSIEEALRRCGLRDGMVISSHHHLRNGDRVGLRVLEIAAGMGVRDLLWFPSASFPCHEPVMALMDSGAVHHIEGSMNGPLGEYCSRGKMRGLGVLRSHGGRFQALRTARSRSTSPSSPPPWPTLSATATGRTVSRPAARSGSPSPTRCTPIA